jgi:hypothetical protein
MYINNKTKWESNSVSSAALGHETNEDGIGAIDSPQFRKTSADKFVGGGVCMERKV